VNAGFRQQLAPIARRSIARTLRQPVLVVPNLIFPLFMLAVLSEGASQVTKVPGFPTKSYITFILGATLVQGASGAMTQAGTSLGADIETGFLSRIALTPVRTWVLVMAQLAGVAVLGLIQALLYLGVGLAAGASVKAGVGGALVLLALEVLMVLSFGALGVFAAVRTRSAERVQGLTALALALMFLSSMVMPRNLITADWFKTIATYNPMSYLVEAPRSLLVTGWDGQALALGAGIAAVVLVIALATSVFSLQRRMVGG
jgi:ABC-2 type transport system permease protein